MRLASRGKRINYLHDIEPHLKSGEGLFQDLDISIVFASAVAKLCLVPKQKTEEQEIKENTRNTLSFTGIKENVCVKEKIAWRAKQAGDRQGMADKLGKSQV